MAFPSTSVLTSFTGADENPLSEAGAWAASAVRTTASRAQRLSNQAAPIAASSEAVWNSTFAADQEVFATIATVPSGSNGLNLFVRCQNAGTSSCVYYNLSYNVGTGWRFYRLSNVTFTALGAGVISTVVAANGDSMGLTVTGTTLEAWHKPSAGAWTSLGTQTDATISGTGKIGLTLASGDAARFDDFGGGAIVVGGGGITAKLREDGSGGNENPWATDLDGVAVTIGNAGSGGGTTDIQILNSQIEMKTTNLFKQHAIGAATADFANGVVRGKLSLSHAGSSDNNSVGLELRATAASGATSIKALLQSSGTGTWNIRLNKTDTFVASVATTIVANTLYEVILNAYGTDSVRCVKFSGGAFPPGTDYKTIAWDIDRAGVGDGFPSAAGKVGVWSQRNVSAATTHVVDDLLAYASGSSVDVPVINPIAGDQNVVIWEDVGVSALQKRATAWYFIRYKAGSAPADENDGTLVTSDGDGMTEGSPCRADGRYLNMEGDTTTTVTGLANGTTYHVRPFAVMWDGTIVAGTSQSATPTAPGSGAPTPPLDFIAAYAVPHVAQRVDLTWTNPSLAGDYKITYRTDGVNPTGPTNGTVLQDWTAYTANSAGSKSGTGLTNGTRYRFAIWHRDAGLTVNTGAFVQKVPVKQITLFSPADATTGLQPNPYLVWATSSGEAESAKPIHYFLEVSTSEASESAFTTNGIFVISSLDDGPSGFEYESSAGVWTALPATGLASADVGKNVRVRFPINVIGQLFWRVSAKQPES